MLLEDSWVPSSAKDAEDGVARKTDQVSDFRQCPPQPFPAFIQGTSSSKSIVPHCVVD